MGAEAVGAPQPLPAAPVVLGLQPSALVDHVARVDWSLLDHISGERGGSLPVAIEDLEHILSEVKTHILPSANYLSPLKTMAGGSVANTVRGLATCFGVTCGIVGACGDDEQGQLFLDNMKYNDVSLSNLKMKKGPTAQCVCLVDAVGNRTMRPCLSSAVRLQADELSRENFRGSKWLVMRYGIFNLDIIHAAVKIAKQEGVFVSLDLASFEMVRNFREPLLTLLESGNVDLCFANEDEAAELVRGEKDADTEAALEYMGKHCQWAVVTLGSNGCIAKHQKEMVRVHAIGEAQASDATGAGDLFASGFLYGLLKGLPLEDCCRVGSCSGGSVIRSLGGDVTPENRQWMYKQMQIKGLPLPDLCN
ncbi:hypothetical protein RJ639_012997 [Escallonia herrerae]|uniref:Carbohydrate kinase PfkB domain-containing protein n=1 Tax=Escallonia herrerae TaxID=1293975 RepID=A0AA88VQS9_9ASTE|nr:hypothetical protein RJ639_012997 [Escallonia herrerae]